MRTWSLGPEDPRLQRLAADALSGPTDYVNDHIWEVKLGGGRPSALAAETTYGRRARSHRLFAGFNVNGPTLVDPSTFARAPRFQAFLPSWRRVAFSPVEGIEVEAEYWVVTSHVLAGRFRLSNTTSQYQGIRVVLYAVLEPTDGGHAMQAQARGGANVLAGVTGNLHPVAFLAGGAVPTTGHLPGLEITMDLAPHVTRPVTWCCAAESNPGASFESVRDAAGRAWDAEIGRLERLHSGRVEIHTGQPGWDAAFELSQVAALQSFVGPTPSAPSVSLVGTRSPDDGYSLAGDGSDYPEAWSGMDVDSTLYLASQLMYAAPELAKGLLDNFLSTQEAHGAVDGMPGPGGQRAAWLCPPRLAQLAWEIYRHTGDSDYLRSVFPRLLLFLNRWFSEQRASPGGSNLCWDNLIQAQAVSRPALAAGPEWGEAADVRFVLSPDLAAHLAAETHALVEMSKVLGESWAEVELERHWQAMKQAAVESWSLKAATFHYRDRETKLATGGRRVARGNAPLDVRGKLTFDPPCRIQVRVSAPEVKAGRVRVSIEGMAWNGRRRREQWAGKEFQWLWDRGIATSHAVYSRLDRLRVEGLETDVEVEVRCADLLRQDLRLLLPMWAGLAEPDMVEAIMDRSLRPPDRFGRPGGWPTVPADDRAYAPDAPGGPWVVELPLQEMLGGALVEAGYRAEAARNLGQVMTSITESLKADGDFSEAYHPERLTGWGRRGHVQGIAPLSYFMHVAGVRFLASGGVELRGRHPFPWPVTIRWRGLTVQRTDEGTRVTLPDGQESFVEPGMEGVVERVRETA
ncbi:MAG TPA: hypothetical protein VFI11_03970 [Anaerolineales bacterium]|nr:hypothetical protein [Anaerolineales bacterium]